jgi:hypothetical protein
MRRPHTDWRYADDVRRTVAYSEAVPADPDIDCRVSANVGDLMAAALMAAGSYAVRLGGRSACETDYLAASGAVFPPVPVEELERFNRETLFEGMDEAAEFDRYRRIAMFFRRTE